MADENTGEYFAHSLEGRPLSDWQALGSHLENTAAQAEQMAEAFGSAGWAKLAGLWHDLGKYSDDFQRYIRSTGENGAGSKPAHVDHSTAGAIWAIEHLGPAGMLIAYQIAGHHSGLPDFESDTTGSAALSQRIRRRNLLDLVLKDKNLTDLLEHSLPTERPRSGADLSLWVRLLFSCLVDGDYLDTEQFIEPEKSKSRGRCPEISCLLPVFDEYISAKTAGALRTRVNEVRAEILSQCIARSQEPPGIFSLTVPTGGGKTLSSMAFALNHAIKYSKRRIIYVIPYTSIIEQTADQFRDIFGQAVIEHQSNLDVDDPVKDNLRTRLACENWDAPIIVTTSVQFFESLFASRSSRCRKLHNITDSVVILDEAQLLPPDFLNPILHVLQELQKNYGVTLLLSSATQPALGPHQAVGFKFDGLPAVTEIIDNPLDLHRQLKRVEIAAPTDLNTPTNWDRLAAELKNHESVLCVVNRRDDCRVLWGKMPEGTFHLSALMCGAHRSEKIKEIKKRLQIDIPTRVISTQLIEAGVDVDFPVVYRALAGLDSIGQAAGRCNREGRLADMGKVVVFVPPSESPPGHLRQAAQLGRQLMSQNAPDILAPEQFEKFFKNLWWIKGPDLDKHQILADLQMSRDFRCSFRTAAEKFKIIDEKCQSPVIVMHGDGAALIGELEKGKPERWLKRRLQRYVVNLPRYLHNRLVSEGAIREIHPGIYVQGHPSLYDDNLGFCADKSMIYEPDELII